MKAPFEMSTLSGPHVVSPRCSLVSPKGAVSLGRTFVLRHQNQAWLCTRAEALRFSPYLQSVSVFVPLPESHRDGLIDVVSV